MIKKGWISKYTKYIKRGRDESPKRKQSPKKTVEVVVRNKGKEASSMEYDGNKGKLQYIASIIGGIQRVSNQSKSMVKRNINDLMATSKNGRKYLYQESIETYPYIIR